jgi:hypothetical protein
MASSACAAASLMLFGLVQGSSPASAVQLVCDLRNLAALVARSDQLVRARHTRAIAAGNRRGTIRRSWPNEHRP